MDIDNGGGGGGGGGGGATLGIAPAHSLALTAL